MPKFMLLIKDNGEYSDYSPAQMQALIQEFTAWAGQLAKSGKLVDAAKLADSGRVLRSKNGQVVDGPFTETKEAVGGYFLIEAANLEDATKIASGCPGLKHKDWVEVRALEE